MPEFLNGIAPNQRLSECPQRPLRILAHFFDIEIPTELFNSLNRAYTDKCLKSLKVDVSNNLQFAALDRYDGYGAPTPPPQTVKQTNQSNPPTKGRRATTEWLFILPR